jgi:hypothetical protein
MMITNKYITWRVAAWREEKRASRIDATALRKVKKEIDD